MPRTAIEPTARNSDCQFCNVVCQKSALPTYWIQLSGSCLCSISSALYELQPVTDWANHEPAKIRPITISSELENSHVRAPPTRAHFGESGKACLPISWSFSDSVPALSSSLDSGEPFWSSHTVVRMKRKNCRYSDCQFSITAWPKLEDTT